MDTGLDTNVNITAVEELLAAVWSEVLDGVPVSRSDNFFDLGGDSLLIIEAVAVAREEGLEFTPLELIEYQTVAELAARIALHETSAAGAGAEAGAGAGAGAGVAGEADPGEFPLTAAQARFCLAQPHPQHVTQSVLWRTDGLDPALLDAALAAVVEHHDSFRLRLHHTEAGARLRYDDSARFELERYDLSTDPADRQAAVILAEATRLRRELDPVAGPLVRAACFELGAAGQRLFVTAHHLAVDSASWRILRGDLSRSLRRLELGEPLDLPAKTSSYGSWAQRLAPAPRAELTEPQGSLPWANWEGAEPGGAPIWRATTVTVHTDEEVTATLLGRVRSELGVGMEAVVVAAVAQAVALANGIDRVRVDIERHGRDTAAAAQLDISRTTGWFTQLQTVLLASGVAPLRTLVKSADQELHGAAVEFDPAAVPAVLVNYLGRFTDRAEELFTEAAEATGPDRHPDNLLSHPIEVNAAVDGARLVTVISCDGTAPTASAAEALAVAYSALLAQLAAELRGGTS